MIDNQTFSIYGGGSVYLDGGIYNGRLFLESEIIGDEDYPDSTVHYSFSKEDTDKLFSIMTLEDLLYSAEKSI